MTISRLSGNRVLIFLGTGDLRDYALDFSRMDASDSRSMRILSSLSRAACKDKGIPTAGKRLSVEALGMNDGCYLLVTVGAGGVKGKRLRSRCATLCYRFERVGSFLDCLSLLHRAGIACAKSRAYEHHGAYYLVFGYPTLPRQARVLLSEFDAKKCPALTASRLSEYGTLLCPKHAVSVIGQYLQKIL